MTFDRAMLLLGVLVGIFLLFFGFYLYRMGVQPWRLSFCIGFGIILAAFGTVANIKTKVWTTTGAGAIAIILYWITPPPTQQYTVGWISGDFSEGTIASVRDREDIAGAFTGNKKKYRMVLLGDHLQSPFLEVEILLRPEDRIPFRAEITKDYVNKLIVATQDFDWYIVDNKLLDADQKPIPIRTKLSNYGHAPNYAFNLFSYAKAAGNANGELSPENLKLLAEKLLSQNYQTRRDARNA